MTLQPLAQPRSHAHDFGAAGAALAGARLDTIRHRYATIVAYCLATWPRLNACVWHGVSWVLAEAQVISAGALRNWQPAWGAAPGAAPPTAAATLARKLIGEGHTAYGPGRGWPVHQDHLHVRLDI
jgi:hypothetical protein